MQSRYACKAAQLIVMRHVSAFWQDFRRKNMRSEVTAFANMEPKIAVRTAILEINGCRYHVE